MAESAKKIFYFLFPKGNKMRRNILLGFEFVIVFVTTYMLVLPAFTQSTTTYCGLEEHTHTSACYEIEKTLVCGQEEGDGHVHTDACYTMENELTCGKEESKGHTHTADCYKTEKVLVCTNTDADHVHDDSCYEEQKTLICGKEESEGHTHTDACYTGKKVLTCGKEEGEGEHKHTDACYEQQKKLVCEKEEHKHSKSCYSNPNADLETKSDWEADLKDLKLTGLWSDDVLTIAESQLGYEESDKNYIVDENDKVKGYTRYGAWYGNEYGDWCAMFCSFCIRYAGMDETVIPIDAGCQNWIEKLNTKEFPYYYAVNDDNQYDNGFDNGLVNDASDFEPKAGDLIFLNWDDEKDADHVGLVAEVTRDEDGAITEIKTIEGNSSDKVEYKTYKPDNKNIMGYAVLPENPDYVPGDEKTVETETAGETAGTGAEGETAETGTAVETESETLAETESETETESVSPEDMESALDMLTTKTIDGADYHITLSWDESAGIPDNVKVTAREITGDEYDEMLKETKEATGFTTISFARFFDVTFLVNGIEIEPTGDVEVQITYDDPVEIGDGETEKAVHFAEDGTEVLSMDDKQTEEGTTFTFTQDSFSTIATAIGYSDTSEWPGAGPVTAKTVSSPEVGKWYILYGYKSGTGATALSYSGDAHTGVTLASASGTVGNSVIYQGSSDVVWMWDGAGFINREGQYLYAETSTSAWYAYDKWGLTAGLRSSSTNAVKYSSTYHILYSQQSIKYYYTTYDKVTNYIYIDNGWVQQKHQETLTLGTPNGTAITQANGWGNDWTNGIYYGFEQYIAEITTESEDGSNYPQPALTSEISLSDIMFYNVDASANDGTFSTLKGVSYTIYKSDGTEVKTVKSGDTYDVTVGKLTEGDYYIEQTGVPDGYAVVAQKKSFTVDSSGYANIGVFLDYKSDDKGYVSEKTAQVIDYANRVYQVNLAAASGEYTYSIKNKNYYLVVDQSNSMLFPAQLKDTGQDVTLSTKAGVNGARMDKLKLETSKVYYIIADESATSTMYAIWYDGNGWCYQDASFYEKAWAKAHSYTKNIQESSKYVTFAKSSETYNAYNGGTIDGETYTKTNGGGLNQTLSGSTLSDDIGSSGKTYDIYTAATSYTRLSDIQTSTIMVATILDSLGTGNTITLELFNKKVPSCSTYSLNGSSSLKTIISAIDNITTTGGTRQDRALRHLLGQVSTSFDTTGHASSTHNLKSGDTVILITDGAPVYDKNGSYTGDTYTTSKQLLDTAVPNAATAVKGTGATLVTIGLGTQEVDGGSAMLKKAASSTDLFFEPTTVNELRSFLIKRVFSNATRTNKAGQGTITDVISDSFYPIDISTKEPLPTNKDTYIDLNGNVISYAPSNGQYGTVHYDSDTGRWTVTWSQQSLPCYYNNTSARWSGHIYLKAKEDFIGGNSIDTNRKAQITVEDSTDSSMIAVIKPETPTVNVRLLPMNGLESEETVFLGDDITDIEAKLQYLLEKTTINKIDPYYGTDSIRNNKDVTESTEGLYNGSFSLSYAGVTLTEEQWNTLLSGESVTVEYTYDDDSSHGAVGYFTFTLTAGGDYPSTKTGSDRYADHQAGKTGTDVELYTLGVRYTAYTIGQSDSEGNSRKENVHNSTNTPSSLVRASLNRDGSTGTTNGWPGTEVGGSGAGSTLETGLGSVYKTDVHHVHVVAGLIKVTKEIDESLVSSQDQKFTFYLTKEGESAASYEITVTVKAGETSGSAYFGGSAADNLARGTYILSEGTSDLYHLTAIAVVEDTNCSSSTVQTEGEDTKLKFEIGTNTQSKENSYNVIKVYDSPQLDETTKRYVYSIVTSDITGEEISYGHGKVTNAKAVYYEEIPVKKTWDSGTHTTDQVYVMLYQKVTVGDTTSYNPVLDADGNAQLILLEADSWKGSFKVAKASASEDVFSNYSVREVTGELCETDPGKTGYQKAVVTNADSAQTYYVQTAEAGSLVTVGEGIYRVDYRETATADTRSADRYTTVSEMTLEVYNSTAYEMPETGGIGTTPYTLGGIFMIALTLVLYMIRNRRRQERRYM